MKTVNSFLVKGEYNTLIDTGEHTEECWVALLNGLKDQGLSITDIDKILITHAHVDHIGMAQRVSAASKAKVHVSELVHPWATDLNKEWSRRSDVMRNSFESLLTRKQKETFNPIISSFFGKVSDIWQNIPEENVEIFDYKSEIDISGKAYETIHCPGHTWTQTCFLNHDSGDFFSADMLLKITPTCVIEADPNDYSKRNKALPQLLESYEALLRKDIKTIYPGHYQIMDNHISLIKKQVDRIHLRTEQVYSLIVNSTNSFLDIFTALYSGKFNFPGLVMALGYLDLLVEKDRVVEVITEDGIIFQAV